jgi:hypothetical protein
VQPHAPRQRSPGSPACCGAGPEIVGKAFRNPASLD